MDKLVICMFIFQLLINIRKKYIEGWKDKFFVFCCYVFVFYCFVCFFILLRVYKMISKNLICNMLYICQVYVNVVLYLDRYVYLDIVVYCYFFVFESFDGLSV